MVSPLTPYEEASEFLDELLGACDEFPGNSTAEASPVEFAAGMNEGGRPGNRHSFRSGARILIRRGQVTKKDIPQIKSNKTFPDRLLRRGNFGRPTVARKLIDVDTSKEGSDHSRKRSL